MQNQEVKPSMEPQLFMSSETWSWRWRGDATGNRRHQNEKLAKLAVMLAQVPPVGHMTLQVVTVPRESPSVTLLCWWVTCKPRLHQVWTARGFWRNGHTRYCNFLFHHVTHTSTSRITRSLEKERLFWGVPRSRKVPLFYQLSCSGSQQEVSRLSWRRTPLSMLCGPKNTRVWGGSGRLFLSFRGTNGTPSVNAAQFFFTVTDMMRETREEDSPGIPSFLWLGDFWLIITVWKAAGGGGGRRGRDWEEKERQMEGGEVEVTAAES